MKKILIWFVLALLIAALTIPVAAAPSAQLTASKSTVNAGDTITVTASVSSMDCKAGGVEVSFDSAVFELTGGKWLLNGALLTDFSAGTKDGVFAFGSATAVSGNIFEITLKVKDSAASGKSSVTVKLTLDGQNVQQSAGIAVACKHKYDNGCDTTCNICGENRSISHSWNSGETDKKATCTENGTKVYTCTVCGEKKTETLKAYGHDYDHACDNSCNNCGEARSTTHDYGTKWSSDSTQHWKKCSVCGAKKDEAAHTPGPEATDYTPQTCTECGYVIKKALVHTHVLSENWVTDDKGHWHTCAECDDIPDYADHAFDNECDKTCDECGYTRETEHVYQPQWSADADGHWHECGFCGDRLEMEPHVPGPEATEFDAQICMICGFELTPMLHQHAHEQKTDAEKHWKECSCGDVTDEETHTWDEGAVKTEPAVGMAGIKEFTCTACGETKTEEIPALEPQPEPQQEGLLVTTDMLIVAGAGMVLMCVLCLVVGILIGKKSRKHYDEY